jgi:hypothetical protein
MILQNGKFAGVMAGMLSLLLYGCTAPKQSEILIKMLKAQEDYFSRLIMRGFDW